MPRLPHRFVESPGREKRPRYNGRIQSPSPAPDSSKFTVIYMWNKRLQREKTSCQNKESISLIKHCHVHQDIPLKSDPLPHQSFSNFGVTCNQATALVTSMTHIVMSIARSWSASESNYWTVIFLSLKSGVSPDHTGLNPLYGKWWEVSSLDGYQQFWSSLVPVYYRSTIWHYHWHTKKLTYQW